MNGKVVRVPITELVWGGSTDRISVWWGQKPDGGWGGGGGL